ncbi:hypothetical protein R1flu_007352 [Riccia fluitans]|uniref:Secreted protein n=1 Tax=Riccia fluitans TaxID=41844 RepID=A0ABD1YZF2_9MARC
MHLITRAVRSSMALGISDSAFRCFCLHHWEPYSVTGSRSGSSQSLCLSFYTGCKFQLQRTHTSSKSPVINKRKR